MIKTIIESVRSVIHTPYKHIGFHNTQQPTIVYNTTEENTIEVELARRQHIINNMLSNFHFNVGDRIYFKDNDPAGEFRITYITKFIHELKDEWPKTDNPMLIVLKHDDLPNEMLYATTNKIGMLAK